jgi:hypothetical protein
VLSIVFLLGLVSSSPVSRRVRSPQSPNLLLLGAREGNTRAEPRQDTQQFDLPAGEALDLFYRFGFFSLSVRVVPRDDFGTWVIREPTSNIFTPESVRQVTLPQANQFQDQFQIYFCDDLDDLMKHYFHDFQAEGVREPYRMFTGSWRTPTTVKYFGISESAIKSDAGFVLVKLVKAKATLKIEGSPKLKEDAAQSFGKIRPGDKDSVEEFVQNHGSHYIESLSVGDAVYQVLALDRSTYLRAKNDVLVEKKVTAFDDIYETYLAPWVVKENGKILIASGDDRVGDFLSGRVFKQLQFASYPSIFEIRKQPTLLKELEFLTQDTTAVIALNFRSLGSLLPSLESQEFYKEIVNTELALWEANI